MNTSIALLALASLLGASAEAEVPAWTTDYAQARQQGTSQQRPLAVIFGTGADGQSKVCTEGKLASEAQDTLANKFVCLYVDLSTPAGKSLAGTFGITGDKGLVISDRTGGTMAYHRDGALSASDITRALDRFSDPNHVVRTTVTDLDARVSYYPAGSVNYQYLQQYSGYCPNCAR